MASQKQPLKLEDLSEVHITASQGFLAMHRFLLAYFKRTDGKGDIATLCSGVYIESDHGSGDPAALSDWAKCVSEVLNEELCGESSA
jgi:hypothetical protein